MRSALLIVRSVGSVLAGYAAMVLLLTVVQEGIFGGVSLTATPLLPLAIAGLLSVLCAVIGGAITALLAPARPIAHAGVIAVLVAIETTSFAVRGGTGTGDPVWFDVAAGLSLMVGAIAGAFGARLLRRRAGAQPQPA